MGLNLFKKDYFRFFNASGIICRGVEPPLISDNDKCLRVCLQLNAAVFVSATFHFRRKIGQEASLHISEGFWLMFHEGLADFNHLNDIRDRLLYTALQNNNNNRKPATAV